MRERSDISDGISWYCPPCKKTKTIRKDSFFAKSKMTLQEWLILLYWWARQYPSKDASEEAEVDKNTACDVYRWLREVCSTTLLTTPIVLGGPGGVCQIDESLSTNQRYMYNQLYISTLCYGNDIIKLSSNSITKVVLHAASCGCLECDTSHTPAIAATLLPIVQRHVAPGTIIWSDQWSAYRNISHLPNVAC